MSLGIMIKGSEGIVLAADSRVTLFNQIQQQAAPNAVAPPPNFLVPATFDNATKLLKVKEQTHVGAVTFGLGALMTATGPRTMQSFMPELEQELANVGRLAVADFAHRLSAFFVGRWQQYVNRPAALGEEINFLVAGYDKDEPYGRAYSFNIPTAPDPIEQNPGPGQFGITWGGQADLVYRLLQGFDAGLPELVRAHLNLTQEQLAALRQQAEPKFAAGIPYQFLPLQDSVDLAIFLIESTIRFQTFRTTVVRGVGGPVEVATITRDGFKFVSQKSISARSNQL
jgi:hypothetical protein